MEDNLVCFSKFLLLYVIHTKFMLSLFLFSIKYTGIFTFITVGFLTGRDLWKLIGNHSLPTVSEVRSYKLYLFVKMYL